MNSRAVARSSDAALQSNKTVNNAVMTACRQLVSVAVPTRITFIGLGPKLLDKDNLAGSIKNIQDALTRSLVSMKGLLTIAWTGFISRKKNAAYVLRIIIKSR